MGEINLVSQPVRLGRTPSSFKVAPPERGEHTNDVLAELGYSADEIAALRDNKVI
jgi:formyl-CoA transferase